MYILKVYSKMPIHILISNFLKIHKLLHCIFDQTDVFSLPLSHFNNWRIQLWGY